MKYKKQLLHIEEKEYRDIKTELRRIYVYKYLICILIEQYDALNVDEYILYFDQSYLIIFKISKKDQLHLTTNESILCWFEMYISHINQICHGGSGMFELTMTDYIKGKYFC